MKMDVLMSALALLAMFEFVTGFFRSVIDMKTGF
jgi:hypothetical protein